MKTKEKTKVKSISKFYLSDKTAIIILLVLPFMYFLIFAPGLLTGSKMMYGSDWLQGGYPARDIISRELSEYKSMPLWYNYIFSGLPTVAGPYGDIASIYPFIRLIIPTHIFWTYLFMFGFIAAGIGMYLFLRSLNISCLAALIGAVAYSFAGNLVSTTYAGHEGRLWAAALFPLAFFFWNKGIISHKFSWFVFAGFTAGYTYMHGHFQLLYYGMWVAFAYFIINLILNYKQNKIKTTLKLIGYAIVSIIIAAGVVAVNFLPFFSNIVISARGEMRGYEFASSWALPFKELVDIIIPQFSGILDNYWGENFFKLHSEYFGVILLLLAGITIFIKFKERRTVFFFTTSIIGTLIALGGHTPFFKLVYYLMPGAKRFRGPSMVFYLVAFSIIVLGTIGLQYIIDYNQQKKVFDQQVKKRLKRYFYFVVVIFILLIIILLITKNGISSSIKDPQKLQAFTNNIPTVWSGALISAILIIISIFLFYQLANRKLKIINLIVIIIPLICFDLWRIDKKFIKTVDNPSVYYAPDEVVNFLRNDTTLYRVYPLYYERSNDGILDLYNIQNVAGYCSNPLKRYQEFLGAGQTVMFQGPNLAFPNFLNLLNAKYIISVPLPEDISRYDARTQSMIGELRNFVNRPELELVYSGRRNVIYKNNIALPRAFLVPNYIVIKDKDKIIERLKDPNFNPLQYVIIPDSVLTSQTITQDSFLGAAKIIEYTPNRITVETESNTQGFLVISENYHPDWFCKVDGKPTKVYPAYHTLRTVYLETGKHKVEFFYYSKFYSFGRLISTITVLFCILVIIISVYQSKSKTKLV